ncbi:MAG: DUF2993 domain-containing protein [Cyanobacteria bacterium J06641_5]
MEFLTVLLLGAIASISPTGAIGDARAKAALQERLGNPEILQVRLEGRPLHQFLLAGKLDRLRVAARGLQPLSPWRIEALDIETDPLWLDLAQLRAGAPQQALRQPLQAAWQTVFTEADLNQALQAPETLARLQPIAESLRQRLPGTRGQQYQVLSAIVDLQADNRLTLTSTVRVTRARNPKDFQNFKLQLATAIAIENGRRLRLENPTISVDDRPVAGRFASILQSRLQSRLDLGQLDQSTILVRLLQLRIEQERLQLVGFVRLQPSSLPEQTSRANATTNCSSEFSVMFEPTALAR